MSVPSNNNSWSNNTSFPQKEVNGSSTRTSPRCFADDSTTVKALRITAYSLVILMSLLGNSLVIAVVYRYKQMRRTTNIFIANMAIADLIITTVYMPRLIAMFVVGATWIGGGTLGLILCKIVPFLHGVSLLVSILTLLLISIERLCTIIFPLKHIFSSKRTKIAIGTVWLVALLARTPYFLALRLVVYKSGRISCSSRLERFFGKPEARDIYYSTLLAAFYALPLVVIIVSYLVIIIYLRKLRAPGSRLTAKHLDERRVKATRNVLRMMIVVTVAFIACWLTYFIAQLVFNKVPCALRYWRLFLAHSNSAVNPCLYVFFNRNFRRGFINIIAGVFTANTTEVGMNFLPVREIKGDEPKANAYRVRKPGKQIEVNIEMAHDRAPKESNGDFSANGNNTAEQDEATVIDSRGKKDELRDGEK